MHQKGVGRRNVLKTIGGITTASAMGGLSTGTTLAAHEDDGTGVRVDQLGYPTDGRKVAVITDEFVDDVDSVGGFEVQEADSGTTVFTEADGTLGATFDDGEPGSGQRVRHADFSGLTTPGEYVVVAGGETSHSFTVGPASEVYGDLLVDVGRLYTLHRANADITDPRAGVDIGPGHVGENQDPNATVAAGADGDFLESYGIMSVAHGDSMDVTGGWYDAGDYGKYVANLAPTVAQLLLAYETSPTVLENTDFQFPPSVVANDPNVGEMPDVLAEAKYGIEFLANMQVEEGALFFKVAAKKWPDMDEAPTDDTRDRYVFGLSSAGTAMGAAVFAQAARLYDGVDDAFASEMATRAKDAFSWLDEYRGEETIWEMSDGQNGGSGDYGRRPGGNPDDPERYWAAAELLRLTGDQQYEDYVQSVGLVGDGLQPFDWNNMISMGHYAYYMADGANKSSIIGGWGGDGISWNGLHWTTGTLFTDPAYPAGLHAYYWGCLKSGLSRGTQILLTEELIDATESYSGIPWSDDYPLALEPLHNVLGRSATGYSYVTNYGEESTQNPHARIVQSQDALMPGMLVGGPHNTEDIWTADADTTSEHVSEDTPHAMSYADEHGSYATNEWAINYTAPLFLLLAQSMDSAPSAPAETVFDAIDADDDVDVSDEELLAAFEHHNEDSVVEGTDGKRIDETDHEQFLHAWQNR